MNYYERHNLLHILPFSSNKPAGIIFTNIFGIFYKISKNRVLTDCRQISSLEVCRQDA